MPREHEPTHIERIPSDVRLTVVLPIRATQPDDALIDRLDHALLDERRPSEVGLLVVDDGSPEQASRRIREHCRDSGCGYLKLDTQHRVFSVGRCRNHGAMYARSPYIMFQDIDLLPYPGFYGQVLEEIEVQGLDECASDFLMFGVVYLTEVGSREFLETAPERRRARFLHYLLLDDRERIAKFSTGTSVNVYRREYFLSRGGNDDEFEGWGFEDLEFNTRCIHRLGKFPIPPDWLVDLGSFQSIGTFRGWKSIYRLQGDLTFHKGLVLFHSWHDVHEHSSYQIRRAQNQRLFREKMRRYVETGEEPEPLPDKSAGRTLVLRDNPFVLSRDFLPKLGEVISAREDDFETPDDFAGYLADEHISRVLFHNPYVNEQMQMLYRTCRERGLPYLVAERGALPGSVFFDPKGFNADSDSYSAEQWDHPMTAEDRAAMLEWLESQRASDEALERQKTRVGSATLRSSLGVRRDQRVLFVPLQRPGDTVVTHQAAPIGSFEAFVDLVREVTRRLGPDWRTVVKPHPLEDAVPEIPGAIVTVDGNIHDLLELADAVLLINSGCGLLAMSWNKPVIHAGSAFYGDPRLSTQASRAEDVLRVIDEGWRPDPEKTLRFLRYLVEELYSFGRFTTRQVRMAGGSRMTATTGIDFEVIRGLPGGSLRLRHPARGPIGTESILFDRYRGVDGHISSETTSRMSTVVAALWPADPSPMLRKLRKLQRDPVRFFADSTSPVLRRLAHPWVTDDSGR